jgi:Lon protease-like protein
MTNFIPIFPLNIVVFPGEKLNMHIFEARYKQLINDCVEQKKSFGIVSATDGKLRNFGTLINVEEIIAVFFIIIIYFINFPFICNSCLFCS